MTGSKKNHTRRKMHGGIAESQGFPACHNLSIFPISDENILKFKRVFRSPMDCFINALELLGAISSLTANMMRISSLGKNGFTKEEIEKIFILITGCNHDFKSTPNSMEFSQWITANLPPGNVVFAGYGGQAKHVYLIGRRQDGVIVYIDPQIGTICDLRLGTCQKYIANNTLFRLMFHSTARLTHDQLGKIGFSV